MTARVVADHAVAVLQRAHLRTEVARAAAEAVREHDRGTGTVDVDVQAGDCICVGY